MDDESWRTSHLVLGAKQFHFISIPRRGILSSIEGGLDSVNGEKRRGCYGVHFQILRVLGGVFAE